MKKDNVQMKFVVEIEIGNDAMIHKSDVADALRNVANFLESGYHTGSVYDRNGNVVGSFRWE